MKRPVQSLITAAGLAAVVALAASPVAAVTPIYMKMCGVDGEASAPEASPGRKPAKPAKKDRLAPAPGPQSDIITGAGAGPDRGVKKPDSKPSPALLVPAIQKSRP